MKHRPHLWVPRPWDTSTLPVGYETERHMTKVLRYPIGDPVTYTDGAGITGLGRWKGSAVERAEEATVPRVRAVHLAVAPPKSRDRQRFIVEKLQELGAARLTWLTSDHGQGRRPKQQRCEAWVTSALEQSRGAWRMIVDDGSLASPAPHLDPPAGARAGWLEQAMGRHAFVVLLFYRGFW